ncbi:MAG: hypothetical protein MUE81_17030 [Thermoflexibacter sp.]|jgi:hypothetical protein|nr:hypothetical protein [Thermoflexibacter sp.]
MEIKDKDFISKLSPTLFWDVDISTLDAQKHAAYIVERVLSRGKMEDFKLTKTYYGKPKIKRIAKKLRYMDDRVLHFCSIYFNVPISDFRCYTTKQSNLTHWNY